MSARVCLANETLNYDKENEVIKYCNTQHCMEIKLPASLQKHIDNGYTDLTLKNLPSGKYILATLEKGVGVNVCYVSYKMVNENISLNPVNILPENRQLCIHQVKGDKLINTYRDGARWYSELYEYRNKEYQLSVIDECIGCGVVYRKLYFPNIEKYHVWVSDNIEFDKRVPFVLEVSKKSFIHTVPSEDASTHMYLIMNDKVNILNESDEWVQVRFKNPKVGYVVGWILKENTNYASLIH
jgi:hypothetical protein